MENKNIQLSFIKISKLDNQICFKKNIKISENNILSNENKIDEIKLLFPYLDSKLINNKLEQCNYSTEKTIDNIFNDELEEGKLNCYYNNQIKIMHNKQIFSDLYYEFMNIQTKEEIIDSLILNLIESKVIEIKKNEIILSKDKFLKDLRKICSTIFKYYLDNKIILKTNSKNVEKLNIIKNENLKLQCEKNNLELLLSKVIK